MTRPAAALGAALVLLLACGCSGGDPAGGARDVTLTVFAASSLTASFEQLGERFEADHDGVAVDFAFAGSSDLVAQIREGAPADVFASADQATMETLTDDDLAGSDPQAFASNTLAIVVPADNPAGIDSLADLGEPGVTVVLCAPEVPCGAAARRLADLVGVTISPASEEQQVTDVLGKVRSGEADAGLVYATDVLAAGDAVRGIEVPEAEAVVNLYPIATVAGSDHEELAQAFVDLVLSQDGQQVLRHAGFAPPETVTRDQP